MSGSIGANRRVLSVGVKTGGDFTRPLIIGKIVDPGRDTPNPAVIRDGEWVSITDKERIELRVAGAEGLAMAEEVYAEYPEAGELFVVRMLPPGSEVAGGGIHRFTTMSSLSFTFGSWQSKSIAVSARLIGVPCKKSALGAALGAKTASLTARPPLISSHLISSHLISFIIRRNNPLVFKKLRPTKS